MNGKTNFKATHNGSLIIGQKEIGCAVLENGQRIITHKSLYEMFNKPRRGSISSGDSKLPWFINSKNLTLLLDDEILGCFIPVSYIARNGRLVEGYTAEVIPTICEIFIEAHEQGALSPTQENLYKQSMILVRALAKVGITALIDEATGYQDDRNAQELQNLLQQYISKDLLKWQKRFPNQYYKEIYRLHNWEYVSTNNNRPGYIGRFTNKYVYDMFPEKVMEIIKRSSPKKQTRFHQYLSTDVGIPELDKHLAKLLGVMALSDTKEGFEKNFERAFAIELSKKEEEKQIIQQQKLIYKDNYEEN